MKLGEYIISRGLLHESALLQALETQKKSHRLLGEILVELGHLPGRSLFNVLLDYHREHGSMPENAQEWIAQSEIDELLKAR